MKRKMETKIGTIEGLGLNVHTRKQYKREFNIICWYVDDLKLSHQDPNEVTRMINILE